MNALGTFPGCHKAGKRVFTVWERCWSRLEKVLDPVGVRVVRLFCLILPSVIG